MVFAVELPVVCRHIDWLPVLEVSPGSVVASSVFVSIILLKVSAVVPAVPLALPIFVRSVLPLAVVIVAPVLTVSLIL